MFRHISHVDRLRRTTVTCSSVNTVANNCAANIEACTKPHTRRRACMVGRAAYSNKGGRCRCHRWWNSFSSGARGTVYTWIHSSEVVLALRVVVMVVCNCNINTAGMHGQLGCYSLGPRPSTDRFQQCMIYTGSAWSMLGLVWVWDRDY